MGIEHDESTVRGRGEAQVPPGVTHMAIATADAFPADASSLGSRPDLRRGTANEDEES